MKAVIYTHTGGPEVLRLVERPVPEPGPGEVRVRVHTSGVNPTDWRARTAGGPGRPAAFAEQVPNQDGAGVVDVVGSEVDPGRVGQRVWIWEAAWQRADGTAQERLVLPERQAVELPDAASFDLGASLGIPAMTAHRALTVADGVPELLGPGTLAGRTVLVAGGAGAVGHAAIELARWSGALVLSTVSSPAKAALATAAGAHHVVDYTVGDTAERVRALAPAGVDVVVEVNPTANAGVNQAVLAPNGTVAVYASDDAAPNLSVPVRPSMMVNTRVQFILIYTVTPAAKRNAVRGVQAALAAGADAGLPLHHFPLAETAAAHAAVEGGAVGKVLVELVE
jgi:NADPH2:quinone reductase